jgi:hypothetical protein
MSPNFRCNSLEECFHQLAKYSNENFFSEDTILDKSYISPTLSYYKKTEDKSVKYGYSSEGYILVKALVKPSTEEIIQLTLQDNKINLTYWQLLSQKAVFGGVEIIRIFHEEAEKVKKEQNLIESPPKDTTAGFWQFALSTGFQNLGKPMPQMPVISLAGLAGNVMEVVANFFQKLGAGVGQVISGPTALPETADVRQPQSEPLPSEDLGEVLPVPALGEEGLSEPQALAELQQQLDDIARRIVELNKQIEELAKVKDEEDEEKKEENAKQANVCPVNINTASAQELQAITGVGPVISQRIIEARPFSSLNELETKVKGIGPVTLQKIINQRCAYAAGYTGGASIPQSDPSVSYPRILISEVQISPTGQRFVELYNPNEQDINLTDWYLQRKTANAASWDSFVSSTKFEGKIISAKSHFLIASSTDADIISSLTLTEGNSLALKNPNREIVDLVGWGQAPEYETAPTENPPSGKSMGRKWDENNQTHQDTGNNSADFEIQTPTPKAKNQNPDSEQENSPLDVVINEIAWMGTATSSSDEWIELHNTTKNPVDLTGWKLVSLTDNSPNITFSGSISPLGFFLLERTDDSTISDILADQTPYTGALKNNPDCEVLTLYDQNNNVIDKTVCLGNGNWPAGDNSTKHTMERIDPRASGENSTNWQNNNGITINGLDAAGNPIKGTPRAQNSVYQTLAPTAISDLTLDLQNSYSNKAVLNWSTSTDSDTLSENLYYFIYYSKNESDLNATSTTHATTTALSIDLNLDYNSTYYFGARAFDGQNYSPLSNTVSYQTATLAVIAGGFPPDLNIANNGRKIVRTSDGVLYTVYSRSASAHKVFLANSTDNGMTWTEIEISSDEDQIHPSLALDSQNNLHIVWQGKVGTSTVYKIRYTKYDGSSFSAIDDFTADENQNQEIPVIALDAQNKIHLAWVGRGTVASSTGDSLYYVRKESSAWGTMETVKAGEFHLDFGKSILSQFSLTPDDQGILHFVWFEKPPTDASKLRHRKVDPALSSGEWSDFVNLTNVSHQSQSSIAVDSQSNAHLVWHHWSSSGDPKVNYAKYTGSWSAIETLSEDNADLIMPCCSIGADQSDVVYLVWKTPRASQPKPVSQREYKNRAWQDVKELVAPFVSHGFPNLFWSQNSKPQSGYAFVFYEGMELKFYGSEGLTW